MKLYFKILIKSEEIKILVNLIPLHRGIYTIIQFLISFLQEVKYQTFHHGIK